MGSLDDLIVSFVGGDGGVMFGVSWRTALAEAREKQRWADRLDAGECDEELGADGLDVLAVQQRAEAAAIALVAVARDVEGMQQLFEDGVVTAQPLRGGLDGDDWAGAQFQVPQ